MKGEKGEGGVDGIGGSDERRRREEEDGEVNAESVRFVTV